MNSGLIVANSAHCYFKVLSELSSDLIEMLLYLFTMRRTSKHLHLTFVLRIFITSMFCLFDSQLEIVDYCCNTLMCVHPFSAYKRTKMNKEFKVILRLLMN